MRTLFARILLWFVATVAITTLGVIAITSLTVDTPELYMAPGRWVRFQMHEAIRAYESGGKTALGALIERTHEALDGGYVVLTDAAGRDLLTGEDRSALVREERRRMDWQGALRRGVLAASTPGGRYHYIVVLPPDRLRVWPRQLWVVGIVLLLCFLLATHLSSPLRSLQKAIERFGRGDFSARINSTRRDEFGELARAFDQMAARIETLMAAERRLLLDISHELRSPLARLGVAVELARTGDNREGALNHIQKEADRLNELVSQLLEITRVEGDLGKLRHEPVRLDDLTRELVEDCSIEAAARGCRLDLESAAPVTVRGDRELIRRAIENVMRNAIRFAPEGTAVEVAVGNGDHSVSVRVRDFGPGVPEEELPKIFQPFYRVDQDRSRASGGMGLGLAIARRAVELHQGSIEARNSNPGLSVEMRLPAVSAS